MVRQNRQAMPPSDAWANPMAPREITRQEFGRNLFKLMTDAGMNQSELGRAANVGRDRISNYVNGKAFPTPPIMQRLAIALDVTNETLLPNIVKEAMDSEYPAIELRQASGHENKAWLRVNRSMSFATAAKIIALIEEEDSKGE